MSELKIIARKPRDSEGNEYVVVARPAGHWVCATVDAGSLAANEWFWGHYFTTLKGALAHFNALPYQVVSGGDLHS